ncbi:YecH family metal-binding protein [Grimontia hollisae]|uniref:YecH family metal-binding protein n=1 Tax=Grimontia hollisae TaxID=673 RepID=UPI0012ACCC3F|nr:YecH family metal-binding protein [Grimontia hollisae]
MSASIHVHEILNHLKQQPMSEQALAHWVESQWGTEACFHTCSRQALSFSEVLTFLRRRKKIVEEMGTLSVNEARVCNH